MMYIHETYLSVDMEADGPIPGPNSMLSLAVAAITIDKVVVEQFEVNLVELDGAKPHPETTKFWRRNQAAYEATRTNIIPPRVAMRNFHHWLKKIEDNYPNPIFVGHPVTFDFMWVNWYLHNFVGENILGWAGFDIKTAISMQAKLPYRLSTKTNMPATFRSSHPHTHIAMDDALEQGEIAVNIIRESLGHPRIENLTFKQPQ